MSTSTQPREYAGGVSAGVQALLYHAGQVGEIARLLNGRTGSWERHVVGSADFTLNQLMQQVRRRSVTSRISLDSAVAQGSSDPLDSLHGSLLNGQGTTQLLVSRSLLADGADPWQLSAYAGEGTAVRVAARDIPRMTLIDGTVAVLGDTAARLTVVRDKAVVRALELLFDTAWEGAVDALVFAEVDGDLLWDVEQGSPLAQVLPLLGSGWTDMAAARELGWSVRTYRRHVAGLMRRLQAKSRFQAGMRTAQLRLEPGPE